MTETPSQRKKVYVALLNQGTTTASLEAKLIEWMVAKKDKYECRLFLPASRPISTNRNEVARDFLAGDWDYLFFFDDDVLPHKNPFDLLDLELPVVGGVYPGRDLKGLHFHVYKFGEGMPSPIKLLSYPSESREGLQQVDSVATGCMAIHRSVLEKIGPAPFLELMNDNGECMTSDDISFCWRCKENDIPVYAHWDHICSHFKFVDLLHMMDLIVKASQTGVARASV